MAKQDLDDSRQRQDDKYNPEQARYDREFGDIVKHYDEETADPAQESVDPAKEEAARERARLGESEDSAGQPPKSKTGVKEGEESGGETPWQSYTRQRAEKKQNNRGMLPKHGKRNRVMLLITAALLSIGGPFAFFFFPGFKLPAIGDMITNEAGERVERMVTMRLERVFFRAMFDRFGNDYDRRFVISGSPMADLYATMRTDRMEAKIERKYGLKLAKNGGVLTVVHNGKDLGSARNADQLRHLINKNNLSNRDIKTLLRAEIPAWRYFKAKKFARWMRFKYAIPRYGYDNDKSESDAEKQAEKMQKTRLQRLYAWSAASFAHFLNCIMGEHGCFLNDRPKQEAASGDQQSTKETVKEAADTAAKDSTPDKPKGLMQTLREVIVKKIGFKAIPIIGWIDLIATLDHFMYQADENQWIDKLRAHFIKAAAVMEYADRAGVADQVKKSQQGTGEFINPYFVGMVSDELNGAEEERAFQYVDGKPDHGRDLPHSQKVNDKETSTAQKIFSAMYTGDTIGPGWVIHQVLNIYYHTIGEGGLLGFIGDKLAAVLSWLTPDWIEEIVGNWIADRLTDIMAAIGRLFVDPNDTSMVFSRMLMGAQVSFDTHANEELDGRELSEAEANEIRTQTGALREEEFRARPIHEQIFATDTHKSFVMQIALRNRQPVTKDINLYYVAKTMGNIISHGLSKLMSPVQAQDYSYRNLFGITPIGATDTELSVPLSQEILQPDLECPDDGDSVEVFNPCKLDKSVVETLECAIKELEQNTDACPHQGASQQTPPPGGTPSATGFNWPISPGDHRPLSNCYRKPGHTGIDIPMPNGTNILASSGGRVYAKGGGGDSGTYIILLHPGAADDGSDLYSNYQHLQSTSPNMIIGHNVSVGEIIGRSDNSGFSTGPHLHFGITTRGGLDSRTRVSYSLNPLNFLPSGRDLGVCG